MEKKFKALRTISVIFKILAWIVAVLTIIGFLVMLVGGAALSQISGRYGAPGMLKRRSIMNHWLKQWNWERTLKRLNRFLQ